MFEIMQRVGGMFAGLASVAVGLNLLGSVAVAMARTNQAPWRMTSYFCLGSIIMPRGLRGRSPRPIHNYCSGFVTQGSQGPQRAGAGDMGRQRGPATCAGNVGPRSAAESLGDHQRPGGSLFWTLLEQGPASE